MKRITYELAIKRGSTRLVTPDSTSLGMLADRVHALLANVAIPGDELVIKVWQSEEDK